MKFKFSGMFAITVFCILITFFAWMEPWERSFEAFVKLLILIFGGFLPLIVGGYQGAEERSIMNMTGHKTTQMVRRYIQEANLFKNNALKKIKI